MKLLNNCGTETESIRVSKLAPLNQIELSLSDYKKFYCLVVSKYTALISLFLLIIIVDPPHLELGGAVTVETLELLLPPKVCLSAP